MAKINVSSSTLLALIPWVFVPIWATGFIAARLGTQDAEPLTFLMVRYVLSVLSFGALCFLLPVTWPKSPRVWVHACISGLFLPGLYLAGTWWSVAHGLPAGLSALISGLQPVLIAVLAARFLGEAFSKIQIAGVVLGFVGVMLVLWPKLAGVSLGDKPFLLVFVGGIALLGVTMASFWQKAFIPKIDLTVLAFLQFCAGMVLTLPFAAALEHWHFAHTWQNWLTMAWSVVGLSVGSIYLLLYMIQHGAMARVSSMMFLVPPTTAIMAFVLFGEHLSALQIAGMAVTALGVALVSRTIVLEKNVNLR